MSSLVDIIKGRINRQIVTVEKAVHIAEAKDLPIDRKESSKFKAKKAFDDLDRMKRHTSIDDKVFIGLLNTKLDRFKNRLSNL
ncbi:MAG: hypothetical protein COA82_03535 [Alkaliphilus sp.]|nr:MAG: hypothetical protein COA82_03535 [Alkaliphilus sp.]